MKQLLFLFALLLTEPCIAHDAKHPEYDSWYRGLKNPNFKSAVIRDLGCCSAKDCHETEADIRNGRWWARVGKLHTKYLGPKPASEAQHAFDLAYEEISWELTEWKEVPNEAILKVSNPTGSPVICHSAIYEIWCFVAKARCLVPRNRGALYHDLRRDELWGKFFAAAPQRLRRSVEQYKIVKRA